MLVASAPPLRLVYMGTSAFAVPSLRVLAAGPYTVATVYTQPARPAGRGLEARPSPVYEAALELGLTVHTPTSLKNPAEQAALAELRADLVVVAAYGLILPEAILETPRLGCINLHASLLPRWRGAAPIQRALLAGDRETGVTVIQMEPSLDTGPILAMQRVPITAASTAAGLHDTLAELAASMVGPAIENLASGRATPQPQPQEGVTHASKIDKSEARLDWTRSATFLERQLRALNPWPGCWTEIGGQRLLVLEGEARADRGDPGEVLDHCLTVACGEGALRLTRLQRAGGRPMSADAFLRGFHLPVGARLGTPCPATS